MNATLKKIILKFISKENIVKIIRKVIFFRNYTDFFYNYFVDAILFYKHSAIYRLNTYQKKESLIILRYHSIEKGLIHKPLRERFAKDKVSELHKLLKDKDVKDNIRNSQIQVAIKILIRYYEVHRSKSIDIEDYYPLDLYSNYLKLIITKEDTFKGVIDFNQETFYKDVEKNFMLFSNSRKSVRHFTGELIDEKKIKEAINLSLNAPSVCNRQANKVYLIDNKEKIKQILNIQGGFLGFIENVSQLLIVTNNRSYYYTLGERNQFYIDGGIYFMNLLYSLHYHRIANCPANWGKKVNAERKLTKIVSIPKNEKIICLLPIGIADEFFSVPLSKRREKEEVLFKL
ncbi:Nitroreductase [Tenacibaculum sp. 190524A02b]|uniref:nitroreductase family protein n=1 Tax=Tenacibaculum vairaonense TaxID=3137860 RepID=UPI0032B12A95